MDIVWIYYRTVPSLEPFALPSLAVSATLFLSDCFIDKMAAITLVNDVVTTGNEETIDPARKGSIVDVDQKAVAEEGVGVYLSDVDETSLGPTPTEDEYQTLRKVAGKMPAVAYTICAVEFAERASYYGVAQIFSNFIQFPLPAGGNGAGAPPFGSQKTAGALGMGLQASSGITLTFKFLSYTLPILGAWM